MTTESRELKDLLASLMHPGLKTIDLSLGRMHRYLAAVGSPERHLPPVVHVAGTNGKGSTIAFLRAMAEAAGKRCHVFTSPHLVHFKERVVVAGNMLEEAELIDRLNGIKARTEEYPLTFFEANAALAFELFAEVPADLCLLEVGMGGRFDATNVVAQPALSLITPISMDHQAYLGNTLAKIAYEKAGIIKQGVPVISAPQADDAMQVLAQVAAEQEAPLSVAEPLENASLGLIGEHQRINAGLAVAAAQHLKWDEKAIEKGLVQARWPGRLQRLEAGPLVDIAPEACELWLDGGHNEQAAHMLAAWARDQQKPVHLICAMSQGKDPAAFLTPFDGVAVSISCAPIPDEPLSLSAEMLAEAAPNAAIHPSLDAAVQALPAGAIGLIAGSLYLAGYVLQKNR